ncbi:MAG: hypothetical protein CVV44_11560 [Spirochaetae bacterium HGW-Spirochaetae-1]|nr:MAG: hypothetical protein CVV44_11560 [Spirochaetae bacterium HGW-Spirochaetae-1]
MKQGILYTGCIINGALAVFHMFFWKIFNWQTEFAQLSKDNRGIVQIANILIIFILLYFSVMSFLLARSNAAVRHAGSFFILISGFYLIRLVTGIIFFGYSFEEFIVWIVCFLIAAGYALLFLNRV